MITRWLNEAPRRGNLAAMAELVSRFPHAPTFATDEELAMMARIAATSDAVTTPVWGIDQEFGETFGNFLSEFAISNGMGSFLISTYVVDSPDGWRNSRGPLADAAGDGRFTLIDLRPLRPLAHQGRIADLSEGFERLVFRADAALIVRGGRTGDYRIVRGEAFEGESGG